MYIKGKPKVRFPYCEGTIGTILIGAAGSRSLSKGILSLPAGSWSPHSLTHLLAEELTVMFGGHSYFTKDFLIKTLVSRDPWSSRSLHQPYTSILLNKSSTLLCITPIFKHNYDVRNERFRH